MIMQMELYQFMWAIGYMMQKSRQFKRRWRILGLSKSACFESDNLLIINTVAESREKCKLQTGRKEHS